MRCIVTAGPTYEPLDQVRRLTNFSTGRLGSELADFLAGHGHEVTLLLGEHATYRTPSRAFAVESFTTTSDLRDRLRARAGAAVAAVFHAAAVSDFAFGQVWRRSMEGELIPVKSGKLSTREGPLLAELLPTPKIIGELRGWFPEALLAGWKFEVEGDSARVVSLAEDQMAACRTDACVANGPAYGPGFGLIQRHGPSVHVPDADALFESLERLASARADRKLA